MRIFLLIIIPPIVVGCAYYLLWSSSQNQNASPAHSDIKIEQNSTIQKTKERK